jgi:hypothetical protein
VQNAVNQRCFAMVNVCDDGYISNFCHNVFMFCLKQQFLLLFVLQLFIIKAIAFAIGAQKYESFRAGQVMLI